MSNTVRLIPFFQNSTCPLRNQYLTRVPCLHTGSSKSGLSEWYSPVIPGTGLHPRPGSASALKTLFPSVDAEDWSTIWYPSRKGEDVDQVHARVAGMLEALVPAVESKFGDRHKKILLVTHAATAIAVVRALVGDRELPLRVGTCSVTEMVRKDDAARDGKVSGAWEAKVLADGKHLKDGASRDWGFEDIIVKDGKVKKKF